MSKICPKCKSLLIKKFGNKVYIRKVSGRTVKKIGIPATTNSLDGIFTHLKTKIKLYRGLKKEKKT
ncbi:hypothetical protein KAZ01_02815 [Candidatus Gracilibacteria bacterium]|nr:hypothetical protein [Candidatus Gracilibacteria bacterium]